ncbi:MAG: VOC family protein [Anaerolineae bacterium]|nr:VOC family protein [Anaerolineae bacterium]
MNKLNQAITGIAEIALRVHDLDLMRRFYEQVVGLELLREIKDSKGTIIFYAVGPGNDHLALFEEKWVAWFTRDKSPQVEPKLTTLSHFAFRIAHDDFESEKKRLEELGIEIVHSNTSSWLHCRMFYFFDPEGNLIEFNSHDESVR